MKKVLISMIAVTVLCGASCTFTASSASVTNTQATPTPSADLAVESGLDGAAKVADDASELIRDLYKQHDAKKSPFFQTDDRSLLDKYFTKELADLIWNDAKTSAANNEVGVIDGDPLYNAQDMEIKGLKIGAAETGGDSATVPVTFTNYGKSEKLTFQMKRVGDKWKISDIVYGPNDSMTKWFKSSAPTSSSASSSASSEASPGGEFEGSFRVGTTSCTVKPVKMAFEVKWEKGSGVEMYFAGDDANSFVSEEDSSGKKNRIVFDDENYNTGKFYRTDGKVFDVNRRQR